MASVNAKPEKSAEFVDGFKQVLIFIEKKKRNLEKRKNKLDELKEKVAKNQKLNEDQQKALDKYEGVTGSIELLKELSDNCSQITLDLEKQSKKQAMREKRERERQDAQRYLTILELQCLARHFYHNDVTTSNFATGSNGAIKLSPEELCALRECYNHFCVEWPQGVTRDTLNSALRTEAENLTSFIDGKDKACGFTGLASSVTFKQLLDLYQRLMECEYFFSPRIIPSADGLLNNIEHQMSGLILTEKVITSNSCLNSANSTGNGPISQSFGNSALSRVNQDVSASSNNQFLCAANSNADQHLLQSHCVHEGFTDNKTFVHTGAVGAGQMFYNSNVPQQVLSSLPDMFPLVMSSNSAPLQLPQNHTDVLLSNQKQQMKEQQHQYTFMQESVLNNKCDQPCQMSNNNNPPCVQTWDNPSMAVTGWDTAAVIPQSVTGQVTTNCPKQQWGGDTNNNQDVFSMAAESPYLTSQVNTGGTNLDDGFEKAYARQRGRRGGQESGNMAPQSNNWGGQGGRGGNNANYGSNAGYNYRVGEDSNNTGGGKWRGQRGTGRSTMGGGTRGYNRGGINTTNNARPVNDAGSFEYGNSEWQS